MLIKLLLEMINKHISTYRVYVRWPGNKITHKTTTVSKAAAEVAWQELLLTSWERQCRPLGLAYTCDGKQVHYVNISE